MQAVDDVLRMLANAPKWSIIYGEKRQEEMLAWLNTVYGVSLPTLSTRLRELRAEKHYQELTKRKVS
jgi:DNA-binding HxlR family transcriptional regulator